VKIAMRGKAPGRGWDEGTTTVEAAITFSILFSLVFGILDFGMALWQFNTIELAVLQAGRYAMVNNSTITAAIAEAQMQAVLPSASISCPLPSSPTAGNWYVCAMPPTGSTPQTMSLSASYGYNIIGLVGPFKVTSQATVPLD
jgi:Flp pilus assembly protein TadG